MNAGITAQYGFLFQRMVFIYTIFANISRESLFVYEGKDDIDVQQNDQIFAIHMNKDLCMQVKSGNVDNNCFYKIICNWLLMNKSSGFSYKLFLENELSFSTEGNKQVQNIINYICEGKTHRKSSISRKTYDLFESDIESGCVNVLKEKINQILGSFEKEVLSYSELEEKIFELFEKDYCKDIIEYSLASKKRMERVISLISESIDQSIKNKKPYSLIYSQFMQSIIQACEEISDNKYVVDTSILKKALLPQAESFVSEGKAREVAQLLLIDSSENFVIGNIINELIYKDFRQVYEQQRNMEISNIEENAVENFKDALLSLTDEDKRIPRKVFTSTIDRPISSDLMSNSTIYRKGCYIYLTGEKTEKDKQLSWGENDDD